MSSAFWLIAAIVLNLNQHNSLSRGELGVEIDYGVRNPSGTLQRLVEGIWEGYCPNGEEINRESLDIESLPPGSYRIVLIDRGLL